MSLQKIVEQCRNGDQRAWHDLVDMVAPVVFSICFKLYLSREESLDIYGQVCAVLVINIHKIRSADRVISYAAAVARGQIGELYRNSRLYDRLSDEALATMPDATERIPDRLYESTQRSRMLNQALHKLPDRDFTLISALFLEGDGVSYDDLARRLEMPVSSIGPTRARSLQKLQRILRRSNRTDGQKSRKPRKLGKKHDE